MLGIDHAELGGLIARSWALPDSLVRGIREHGRPGPDSDALVHAVYLSDALAKAVGAGIDDNPDPGRLRPGRAGARPLRGRCRRAERSWSHSVSTRSNAASTSSTDTLRCLRTISARCPQESVTFGDICAHLGLRISLSVPKPFACPWEAHRGRLDSRADARSGGSAAVAVAAALALAGAAGPGARPSPVAPPGRAGRIPANAWVVTQAPDGQLARRHRDGRRPARRRRRRRRTRPASPQRPARPARSTRSAPPARTTRCARSSGRSTGRRSSRRGRSPAAPASRRRHRLRRRRQPPGSRRLGAPRHRLRQPGQRRSHRPQRSRHARRRHHRRARQQRPRHRRRGARRADPSGARARRERRRRRVERRQGHHLGGRSRRPRDQPEPRWRHVARHAAGDPVREQQGCGRVRGGRQQRPDRQHADVPGRVPRGDRGRRGRQQPHAPVVRQHRQLRRRRRRPAIGIVSTVGHVADRVRARRAARRWRRRTRRPKPR